MRTSTVPVQSVAVLPLGLTSRATTQRSVVPFSGDLQRLRRKLTSRLQFTRHRLHKTRLVGIVLQRLPDLANRCIDPVFGIYKSVIAPETLNDLLPRDQVAVLFQQ